MRHEDAQIQAVTASLDRRFGKTLLGLYLHGSAVSPGGLRRHSDIDLLAIIGRPILPSEARSLLADLLRISHRHPAPPGPRCIELMLFERDELVADAVPRAAFLYGEWLRSTYETSGVPLPERDPDHVLLLAQLRRNAVPLLGPQPSELLPPVSAARVRMAMRGALPALVAGLQGDERNVLLTLARMWRTAATGEFVAKDEAADWAMARLDPADAALVALARAGYRGEIEDALDSRTDAAAGTARRMAEHVAALLQQPGPEAAGSKAGRDRR